MGGKAIRDGPLSNSSDRVVLLAPESLSTPEEQVSVLEKRPWMAVWDIPDPFIKPLEAYVESARILKEHIERNFNLLAQNSG